MFVPAEHREIAFADLEIPIGHGEAMMQPKVEARVVQELAIKPHETVYEVGTGSGYLTALLASFARHVTSAEIHADFSARAAENLQAAGIANTTLIVGDSAARPLAESAFDVIVVAARCRRAAGVPGSSRSRRAPLRGRGRCPGHGGDGDPPGRTRGAQLRQAFRDHAQALVNAPQPARFRF
jgi:protein-L-isoaspartate(D-aspartate) O-methyltransferase